ncbi:hypothetical protein [Methylorubrum sp. POS3]
MSTLTVLFIRSPSEAQVLRKVSRDPVRLIEEAEQELSTDPF